MPTSYAAGGDVGNIQHKGGGGDRVTRTMTALRWWGRRDVRVDTIPVPTEIPDG